jgi:hypothetical protein
LRTASPLLEGSSSTHGGTMSCCPHNRPREDFEQWSYVTLGSNSSSGRHRELDQFAAVGHPTHIVQFGSGSHVFTGEGQRRVASNAARLRAALLSLPNIPYVLRPLRCGQRLIPSSVRMTALFVALFASLRATFRSRLELAAEVLALRHQLAVLQRAAPKRPRLRPIDRLIWVLLSSIWPNWRRACRS